MRDDKERRTSVSNDEVIRQVKACIYRTSSKQKNLFRILISCIRIFIVYIVDKNSYTEYLYEEVLFLWEQKR